MSLVDPKRILVVKLSSMGDVLHTLPALEALHRAFPRARIDWLVNRDYADLLSAHPRIHRLFFFERSRWGRWDRIWKTPGEAWALIRCLQGQGFDWTVDFQGLLRSAAVAYATRAPVRVGFANGREGSPWFYTHRVPVPRTMHAVDRYLHLVQALGAPVQPAAFHVPVGEVHRREADRLLACRGLQGRAYIAVAPSARWESKRWPPQRFAELLDRLWSEDNRVPLLLGGAGDIPVLEAVASRMRRRPPVMAGEARGLVLAALLSRAEAMVANDTGPMHLAAAVGTRVVALFGPTDPARTGPYGEGHRVVRRPVSCSPCFRRRCPTDHACMEGIPVDEVAAAVRAGAGKRSGVPA